jgi:hypothetical protein
MCVSDTATPIRIAVQVTPSTDRFGADRAQPFVIPPFEVAGPSARDLLYPTPAKVFGRAHFLLDGTPTLAQAEVTFRPSDTTTTGGATPITSISYPEVGIGLDMGEANYSASVFPGVPYEVTVTPTGEHSRLLPPLRFFSPVEVADGLAGAGLRLDIEWPELVQLNGRIVESIDPGGDCPHDGFAVRAIDATTGAVLSSLSVTDCDGAFTINMLPETELGWVLQISPGTDRPLFPTFIVDPAYLYPDPMGVAQVLVPSPGRPVDYVGYVEHGDHAAQGEAGALLTFRSDSVTDPGTGVIGTFTATATSDAGGLFELTLLPGSYEVVITPASESELAVTVETITVTGGSVAGQLFALPRRSTYGGTMQTTDMRVMPGAMIEARALARMDEVADPAARFNRSSDTISGPTGLFELRLDIGTYDLLVKPPAASGFAWIIEPDVSIGADAAMLSHDFEFQAPVPLSGGVRYVEDGLPIGNADVQAFAIVPDERRGMRAVPVGRTTTDSEGNYVLLLPPRIGPATPPPGGVRSSY